MNSEQVVRKALTFLFENYKDDRSEFLKYFSPNFKMWKDGVDSNLEDLITHFAKLQATVPERSIHFVDVVSSASLVFDQHTITVRKADGDECVDVFAKWTVQEERIVACEELTRRRTADYL